MIFLLNTKKINPSYKRWCSKLLKYVKFFSEENIINKIIYNNKLIPKFVNSELIFSNRIKIQSTNKNLSKRIKYYFLQSNE